MRHQQVTAEIPTEKGRPPPDPEKRTAARVAARSGGNVITKTADGYHAGHDSSTPAAAIARALGGHRAGAGWMARCPAHDDRTPSLSIRDAGGRVLVHCHAGCAQRDVIAALRSRGLWPDDGQPLPARHVPPPRTDDGETERREWALRIWRSAREPAGTPVEAYLAARGVPLPPEAAGTAIRWHPDCPFAGERAGCMVALVRDVLTDRPLGIHRTAIGRDGHKRADLGGNGRLTLGPMAGGAIKLTPDADVTLSIGVGEGLESTLSLRALDGCEALSVWALLSAGNLGRFPVLPGIESLWIAVDHEPTGILAARELAARWQAAGREVLMFAPAGHGRDLNDEMRP